VHSPTDAAAKILAELDRGDVDFPRKWSSAARTFDEPPVDPVLLYNASFASVDVAIGELRGELEQLKRKPPRERRTGAAARVNPDNIHVFYGVLAGSLLLPIFTFAASFAFQRAFGVYTPLPEQLWWIIPCILELPLVVLTPMILVFRRRHESTMAPWAVAILLTVAAAAINFVHAVEEMPAEPALAHWFGAAFIAAWPILTLVTFKFFARLAVKPERPEPAAVPAARKPTTTTKKRSTR
jgi:hypothetical protein